MSVLAKKLKFEQDWYKRLIQHGNEKILLASFIKSNLLKTSVDSFLEVGMGTDPIFATILSERTNNYLIIEKEERKELKLPANVQFMKSDFEATELESKFDAILLSHVVYYFQDLKKTISNCMKLLSKKGKLIFIVNGPSNDYGKLKEAFSKITKTKCNFTYFKIKDLLKPIQHTEYSLETSLEFSNYEQLYENIRLFFDLFPDEFNSHRNKIISWLRINIRNNKLNMDQKILVVGKTNDFEEKMEQTFQEISG